MRRCRHRRCDRAAAGPRRRRTASRSHPGGWRRSHGRARPRASAGWRRTPRCGGAARPAGPAGHPRFPRAVHADAHEVVHQIVAAGDAREHRADPPRLVLRPHLLVAEGSGEPLTRLVGRVGHDRVAPEIAGRAGVVREGARTDKLAPLTSASRMPELPEVETITRALAARLSGHRIVAVEQRRPDLRFPLPERLVERLVGRRLVGFGRRAKYILGHLDDQHSLLLHLGMSGRLLFDGPPAGPHEHLTFHFDDASCLRFVDPRRFGMLDLAPTTGLQAHPRLAGLGLEPLDPGFDGAALAAALAGRQTALKLALMDQRVVVGVGNIYACEGLFRARLSPRRIAGHLRPREAARLAEAVRAVLMEAIEPGGPTPAAYVAD